MVFFQTGAHVSQAFVNYPAWQFIDRNSFPAYHRAMAVPGAALVLLGSRVVELLLAIAVPERYVEVVREFLRDMEGPEPPEVAKER